MLKSFNFRTFQRSFLDSCTSTASEYTFIATLEEFLNGSANDHLLGGYSEVQAQSINKSLKSNALFIETFAQLASYYSHSGFSQTASMAGLLFNNYGYDPDTMFSSLSFTQTNSVSAQDIKTILTHEQWLALKHYFALPESGDLDFSRLSVAVPRHNLSQQTGLHPKQVPLALDAALSITSSLYANSLSVEKMNHERVQSNLLMVRALFCLAGWLRQIDYAEYAQTILDQLYGHAPSHPVLMLDCCLTSLRYQWREQDFAQLPNILSAIEQSPTDSFTDICLTHINDLQDVEVLSELTGLNLTIAINQLASYSTATTDDISKEFTRDYAGCIVIRGPEFLARQWLQLVGNQYQPNRRYYAIPTQTEIHAIGLDTNGEQLQFKELDALLSHCQPSKD
ncbi:MAG: hypothetical protein KJO69_00255 [Gammaproteobacteria bacterium]|nr:hypothetical protein [Gammaproteobacteria bacterium]NNJ73099.1 hypothetical protein [Enterobacterales bacterium]